jgi:predicted enzyme related to lactoylglutathione lyase
MKRVTGIGGVFFKSRDPKALAEWYRIHLGLHVEEWGGGCEVEARTDDSEYGKFGWVMDPEGNKVELWQPPAGR